MTETEIEGPVVIHITISGVEENEPFFDAIINQLTWKIGASAIINQLTWKIGASASLLTATMTLESFMPARCWMAPEMPTAM